LAMGRDRVVKRLNEAGIILNEAQAAANA
jgi:hypothetical protein